jgi:hypothetical protein
MNLIVNHIYTHDEILSHYLYAGFHGDLHWFFTWHLDAPQRIFVVSFPEHNDDDIGVLSLDELVDVTDKVAAPLWYQLIVGAVIEGLGKG